ncbi:hypothetical protein HA402_001378 [Bradysia odoriphaga]|nr:hypothetical protein HA402_001378 [Bradysia odoriphaga]
MEWFVGLGILIFAMVANAGVSMHNPFFCYTTDPIRSTPKMHSTMSSYEAITRFNYTGADSTVSADIARNYDAGRTSLCRHDFEAIRDWTRPSNFNIENASLATAAGVETMQRIARRYQESFPDILTEDYSRSRFHFRHTETERTNTSIRAFATGLFGEASQNVVYEDVPENDWFLRPFDFCPEFSEQVSYLAEREAFRVGPEFEEMMEQVNRKLGFHGPNQLSVETVLLMWDWCRYETASTFEFSHSATGDNATWCAPFSVTHQLLLEFFEDLGSFYSSGYGVRNQRLLENLNCGLMQDMLTLMQSDDPTDQLARIFVTYTQEIQGMLVALGAFRDAWPPHQHNYAHQTSRQWATSLIAVHASNLAVVRFE